MTQSLTIFFLDRLRTTGGCQDDDVSQSHDAFVSGISLGR